jgi:hypothetical protein
MNAYPNPFSAQLTFRYKLNVAGTVKIEMYDATGRLMSVNEEGYKATGDYKHLVNTSTLPVGDYIAILSVNNERVQTAKVVKL